jgi:transketolase
MNAYADAQNMKSIRNTFGETLVDLGKEYPDVMVFTAELMGATRCDEFAKTYPDRFFDVGIAEQNAFGIAAGMAACGKISIVCSYANFACLRAGEHIRNDIAYTNLNVKIVALSSGLTFGVGGATHQSYEDLAVVRALPNFVVIAPADAAALDAALRAAVLYPGPVFIRAGRDAEYVVYPEKVDFEIGKSVQLREGNDVCIIAAGYMVHEALCAAAALAAKGYAARVLDMHTIKPIDREAIVKAARECKAIITVEEHNIFGGLGSSVLEALEDGHALPVQRIGIQDEFPIIGPTFALRKHLGLHADNIYTTALKLLKP